MLGILEMFRRSSNKAKDENEEGTPSKVVLFTAELVGTAMLLFLGCMGCVTQMVDSEIVPQWSGLTFGLTVMTIIQTVGHISGAHLNPQVTLGAVILGKLELVLVPLYIVAQIIGAFVGFAAIWALTPTDYQNNMCLNRVHTRITIYQALFVEVIITAFLLMVCGAVWDARNSKNSDSIPLRFGLFIALISMVAGPYTGASMNSARSLVPAVFSNNWADHWVYWAGPTIGAIIGSSLYRFIFDSTHPVQ